MISYKKIPPILFLQFFITLSPILQATDEEIDRASSPADMTMIIYMAADNNLRSFAARNIDQARSVGSSKHINIVIHLDIRIAGNKKITRRYYINDKKEIIHMNANDPDTQMMDSGQPSTLISACQWAIRNFPAKEYMLVLWNHGTGFIDPVVGGKLFNPADLFVYNPALNILELDRTTSIFGNIDIKQESTAPSDLLLFLEEQERLEWQASAEEALDIDNPKGICWDDSTGNYLTNQKLDEALATIRKEELNNKKFCIIAFDACLMSMVEISDFIKKHADIMVGSQEVELGAGWNYQKVLEPFAHRKFDKREFAKHIVKAYEETYKKITNDYTQSAISLTEITYLEENINNVASLLISALLMQTNKSVINAIRASKNKLLCTHFDEPSYIDLHHFYSNLETNLKLCTFTDQAAGKKIINDLKDQLTQGKALIQKIVFANCCGKNLSQAKGISIYFPETRIHSSYFKTTFAGANSWLQLLQMYIAN